MSIFCRHRRPIVVARCGKNELSAGFTMSVICSRCLKDLPLEQADSLPVLITADEFRTHVLKQTGPAYLKVRRWPPPFSEFLT